MFEGLQFEPRQRHVIGVQIDRDHVLGPRRQIIQHIATARRDGDQPMLGPKLQRLKVDCRVFPNLIVDEALEHQSEKTFQGSPFCRRRPLMRSAFQKDVSHRSVFPLQAA